MKGVYILTALVGLGIATWVTILIINGVRSRLGRRVIEAKREDRGEDSVRRDTDGGPRGL